MISELIETLRTGNGSEIETALMEAGFLFEKARTPRIELLRVEAQMRGWTPAVIAAEPSKAEIMQLRSALIAFIERSPSTQVGAALWALGKLYDPTLIPVFQEALRSLLLGNPAALYQAMIALDNVEEPVFGDGQSMSLQDVDTNRKLAQEYLQRESAEEAQTP